MRRWRREELSHAQRAYLDADCRVLGVDGLRVVDASVTPAIPSGNTYPGCVMVVERVARKMKVAAH